MTLSALAVLAVKTTKRSRKVSFSWRVMLSLAFAITPRRASSPHTVARIVQVMITRSVREDKMP